MNVRQTNKAQSPYIPEFKTLLWDNVKTTAVFSGCIAAPFPAIVGGVLGFIGGLFSGMPSKGAQFGAAAVAAVTASPVGVAGAAIFSIPFAISARYTRKFLHHDAIDPALGLLYRCHDSKDQNIIIQKIIAANKEASRLGIRSYESFTLMTVLEGNPLLKHTNTFKWQALKDYVEGYSNGRYINNGKKLFNMIINILDKAGKDDDFLLRQAIQIEDGEKVKECIDKKLSEIKIETNGNEKTREHNINLFLLSTLTYAITHQKPHVVSDLFDRFKKQIDATNDTDTNFVHVAAQYGSPQIMKFLFRTYYTTDDKIDDKMRAMINQPNNQGATPLMLAAERGNREIVELLVTKGGANVNYRCEDTHSRYHNQDALQLADIKKHGKIGQFLVEKGAPDHLMNVKKSQLERLFDLIQSNLWHHKGWGLFGNHVPHRVRKLKQYMTKRFQNVEDITQYLQQLNREAVHKMIAELQDIVGPACPTQETAQEKLYDLVNHIGTNTEQQFADLSLSLGKNYLNHRYSFSHTK